MKYGGGIAPVLSLILIFYELVSHNHKLVVNSLMRNSPIKASIICSSILFLSGGFIGVLITSMNVTVPAHYHGSIVGISVAFMGFSFLLCDNACNNEQKKNSYSSAAIITLTIGQMLHIITLLLAGGYGVMRKTPGVEMAISSKLLMGAMGGGELIAIVGGLMFVVICGKKMVLK
ncbi:heme-copper oxidase family protein [Rickettsia endosymbiont of Oedothorax gibbosus]|uniref:hypothetical protein n=1 Tax=Rickettsia endosymbiont of Oedothorax gibbosus TaxID=931099 RepID=UPI00202446FA|nr:hypothetical protein [Rickettsia endosymbiont of Oedothorax gibbosus]